LDFADAFELMLMKRFQQMFSTECSPREVCKYFFDTTKNSEAVRGCRCLMVKVYNKRFQIGYSWLEICRSIMLAMFDAGNLQPNPTVIFS
jgi:hypothetical protein